jgi:phospholipase C
MPKLKDCIDHIVVLMLENRSFDCMLGALYPGRADFNGLSGIERNQLDPSDPSSPSIGVWNSHVINSATMTIPDPDPGELYVDINQQLFGQAPPVSGAAAGTPTAATIPGMSGFVANYLLQKGSPVPQDIMHFFLPPQLPVISELAKAFAVCDQWHASAPCQTWPNRFFVHTGTANGYVNNAPAHFPYEMPTVFNQLLDAKMDVGLDPWKVYFHDFPQSLTLAKLWEHVDRFRVFAEFKQDAAAGNLPAYSFMEPRYFPDLLPPNDAHPPHDVTLAEQLIAEVYNSVRNSPNWDRTLLIITFDEHGGCYDHVPPPAAVPPDDPPSTPFAFDRYGVRVPAVLISPWIAAGTILKEAAGVAIPFDHTSVIATLGKRWDLGAPLTARVASAPDVESVLTLPTASNNGPASIVAPPYGGTNEDLQRALHAPLNDFQSALHEAAANLPDLSKVATAQQRVNAIAAKVKGLFDLHAQVEQGLVPANQAPIASSPADALPVIRQKLRAALGRD